MKNTELAACDYRVTAETELELTEQKLNQQQRDSVAALSNVVTGEVRLNAGDEGAFMASQCLSQVCRWWPMYILHVKCIRPF